LDESSSDEEEGINEGNMPVIGYTKSS